MRNQEKDYFKLILDNLKELKETKPDSDICQHLAMVLTNPTDLFNMTEKELAESLTDYIDSLSYDTVSDKDMEKLIADTEDLFKEVEWDGELLDEEE